MNIRKFFISINNFQKTIFLIFIFIGFTNLSNIKSREYVIDNLNINKGKKLKSIEIKDKLNITSLNWEKIEKSSQQKNQIIWEKDPNNYQLPIEIKKNIDNQIRNEFSVSSLNRSIIINENIVGPDISWIVPPGLKWSERYKFDFSIRGNSGLENNNKFLSWNGGDAVGQYYYQFLNNRNSSFGLNFGMRSVQGNSNLKGGTTPIGEGISMGFRYDYKINKLSGIAFGGEQILHFDGLTDTGRDLYITASKAWPSKNNNSHFPIYSVTGGFATGKMAEGNIKGLCSNLFGGSATEIHNQRSLCWAPVFSLAKVYNPYLSNFFEYNSKHFLLGTSLAPFSKIPLRGTIAFVLSDHIDNYKIHQFKEMSYVFRLSFGF